MQREPNTEYILSLSYGKDSIACLEAIKQLGYPLDRIVHAEVWATDDIPADLPPMVEFKKYADKVIKEMYDIDVEHICATRGGGKFTYDKHFYSEKAHGKRLKEIYGFPFTIGAWCHHLKDGVITTYIRKGNIREIVLPHSESAQAERERRVATSRSRLRSKQPTQNGGTQTNQSSVSPSQRELGATADSKKQPYGFPISINKGNWCTQLKKRVFRNRPCTRREEKYCAVSWNSCR